MNRARSLGSEYSAAAPPLTVIGPFETRTVMQRFVRIVSPGPLRMILLLAVGAALLAAPGAGAAGQAGYGCAPGFDVGGVTLEQFLNLPRNQAGLAAGAYNESSLVSKFNTVDHNGDGVICVKDVATLNGNAGPWQYFYNTVDDNASAPTG